MMAFADIELILLPKVFVLSVKTLKVTCSVHVYAIY